MKVHAQTMGLAILLATGPAQAAEHPFVSAFKAEDVDEKATRVIGEGLDQPRGASAIVGLAAPTGDTRQFWWAARPQPVRVASAMMFDYRIAFVRPIRVGHAFIDLDGRSRGRFTLHALRPEAEFPGDAGRDADWLAIPTHQVGSRIEASFPPGFATRAMRLRHVAPPDAFSILHRWSMLSARLHNETPYATAQGEQLPRGGSPQAVIEGRTWQNTAPDEEERIQRRPVSPIDPSWFNLVWNEPRTLSAVRVAGGGEVFRLYAFIGDDETNPALGGVQDWRRLRIERVQHDESGQSGTRQLLVFPPVITRALKLEVLETRPRNQQIFWLSDFSAYRDLGDAPLPQRPKPRTPPLPIPLDYTLGVAGHAALVIDDADGRRVRNLYAQVPREAGANRELWDLRDAHGVPLAPGTYTWKAISAPLLTLHYEQTLYPNVEQHSPESLPWNAGPRDGWGGNHGNQNAVCVVGDTVYMGVGSAEGGHELIATNPEGAKQWGVSHASRRRLFTDGTTLYGDTGSHVSRLDADARKWDRLLSFRPSFERRFGNLVGLAAHDGRIALAFAGQIPYLADTANAGMVDLGASLPKLPASVPRSDNYGIPLSPQRDFLSFWRLQGNFIAGDARNTVYLESTEGVGRRQHAVLAFRRPVPLGSLVFPRPEGYPDIDFRLSVLSESAPWPPNARREADWIPVEIGEMQPWNVVPAPPGTETRAIRLAFVQAGDDLLEDVLEGDIDDGDAPRIGAMDLDFGRHPAVDVHGPRQRWKGKIEGMRLLRMRFESVLPTARVRVNSGVYDPEAGEWDARRSEPLTEDRPAIYVMEWDSPQAIRGVAIKEIDGLRTELDVYTGPGQGSIDIESAEGWTHVGTYRQALRNYYQPDAGNNAGARYLDGTVDFGRTWETRAVRLRVVEPWSEQGGHPAGVRQDRGGRTIDPTRCRIYGVAPLSYLGGEAPLDPLTTQRLVEYDAGSGKFLRELPSALNGPIAFHPGGDLYGLFGRQVVRVADIETGRTEPWLTDLENPRLLTFDGQGRAYVFDQGHTRRVVRLYDADGRYLRDIGRPGPRQTGPYDPASLHEICAISVDAAGETLWMVYPHEDPRRIMRFRTADGAHLQDYLGNTHYGGGGILDPFDKSRLWYKNVLFGIDWEQGSSGIDALVSLNYHEASPWSANFRLSWRPIVHRGRTYMVSNGGVGHIVGGGIGSVYVYDENTRTVRMAAAFGNAAGFPHLRRGDVVRHLDGPLGQYAFIWTDRNGDGAVQLEEVEFTRDDNPPRIGRFADDLSALACNREYRVAEFLADGTPVYEVVPMPFDVGYRVAGLRFHDGTYFRHSTGWGQGYNEGLDADGQVVWRYPAHAGMDGLNIYPWAPGKVDMQFGVVGHEVAHTGDLGEFFVTHANNGMMNLWTSDGLLAGRVTFHTRDPNARGWPNRHDRGVRMDGLTLGQEHFSAYFCRTYEDDRYYIVVGGSWISLIEVQGLDQYRRTEGTFEVTTEVLARAREWAEEQSRSRMFATPRIVEAHRPGDTPEGPSLEIDGLGSFRITHDAANLNLRWEWNESDIGPFTNEGSDYRRIFKTGAAVDLLLGTDPQSNPNRDRPVAGDLRIVMANVNGRMKAVLYRPVSPGAAPEHAWSTSTPGGGATAFDEVRVLNSVRMQYQRLSEPNRGTLTATIPLADLGLDIRDDMVLRMDWGFLTTRDGFNTSGRRYWANQAAVGVSDEPTEARLTPNLWGYLRFPARRDPFSRELPVGGIQDIEDVLDDMLDSLLH